MFSIQLSMDALGLLEVVGKQPVQHVTLGTVFKCFAPKSERAFEVHTVAESIEPKD